MKRLCLLLSEFWQHDSVYKNWDHMKFSLFDHKSPTPEVAKKSQEQEMSYISYLLAAHSKKPGVYKVK